MTGQTKTKNPEHATLNGMELQRLRDTPNVVVELFNPQYHHVLKTHERDELYFVETGTAELIVDGCRTLCAAGDRLAVPAHVPHYFDRVSPDFTSWAVLLP